MQFLKDILQLFYVDLCVSCKNQLLDSESILCSMCLHDLPTADFQNTKNNKVSDIFFGKVPIENAISYLIFRKIGPVKELMHELKYNGNQEIGKMLGIHFGNLLKAQQLFTNIDYIIPVPLHPKRKKERGYNQLTTFGKTLSEILGTSYKPNVLQRVSATQTQTLQERFERFSDANTKFFLVDTSIFENKNILLIDDVITTGATLTSCCKELLKTKNIKLHIATMAYTERV